MNRALKIAVIMVLSLMAGCSVGPTYVGPAKVAPEEFKSATSQMTNSTIEFDWWKRFNDPLLNRYVDEALKNNLSIRIAAENIKMADAFAKVAASRQVPTIGLGAGYTTGQFSEQGPLLGPLVSADLIDKKMDATVAGATIAWEPDLFGAIQNQVKASEYRAEQAKAVKHGMEVLVTSGVIDNYLKLRGAQQRKLVIEDSLEAQQEIVNNVKKLHRSGLVSDVELSKVVVLLETTKGVVPQLNSAINAYSNRLAILMGKKPMTLQKELEIDFTLPRMTGNIPIGLSSDLLLRRPDIVFAELSMKVANAQQGIVEASKYPRVFLTGTPGFLAGDFDDLFNEGSDFWLAGVGAQWNLFDGGLREALEDASKSKFAAAELSYKRTWLNALGEVETMLTVYGNLQKNGKNIDNSLVEANQAYDKIKRAYAAGLTDYNTVLVARQQVNSLKDMKISNDVNLGSSLVGVYKSLGGGWDFNHKKDKK